MKFINLKTMAEEYHISRPTVLCLGNFDGVHIGHRQLVSAVLKLQNELLSSFPDLVSGAWFFDSNFYKNTAEIYSLSEKIDIFASLGLDYAIIADFNKMKALSPDSFVNDILRNQAKCIHAVCGDNFRFGAMASGNSDTLVNLMDGHATVISLLTEHNTAISSTYIRSLLMEGKIEKANSLLSANYSITEPVVYGKQLGRTLGIPTINQNIHSKQLILKDGIYATICTIDGKQYHGVTNVGVRPTIKDGDHKNIETHIIEYSDNCYDKNVKIEFIARIRDEMKFDSIYSLKNQIQQDIITTQKLFLHK